MQIDTATLSPFPLCIPSKYRNNAAMHKTSLHSLWRRECLFRQAGSLTYDESPWSGPFYALRRSAPLLHNVCDIHGDNSFGLSLLGSMSKDLHPEVDASVNTPQKKSLASTKQFPWLSPLLLFTLRNCLQTYKTLAMINGTQNESMQNAIINFCLFGVIVLTGTGLTSMTIELRTIQKTGPKKSAVSDHQGAVSKWLNALSQTCVS